jgi:hypothetical protein
LSSCWLNADKRRNLTEIAHFLQVFLAINAAEARGLAVHPIDEALMTFCQESPGDPP